MAPFVAAGIAIASVGIAGATAIWVFRRSGGGDARLWELLFSDRATLGFIRATLVMLAIYAIGSSAALLASGRWIRSVSKSGVEVDAAESANGRIDDLKERLRRADKERDELVRLLEVSLRG